MRTAILLTATLALPFLACDEKESAKGPGAPDAKVAFEASAPPTPASTAPQATPGATDAGPSDAGAHAESAWDGSMPPRPVPKASPTVGSGMPAEKQMQAIAYMTAMVQPRFDDAPADASYAQTLATQLKSIAMSIDHG